MQSILGTAHNLSLDILNTQTVPTVEWIVVAGDVDYSINAADGSLQKNLMTVTHRFKLTEADVDQLVSKLLNLKTMLKSFSVDISVEDE